MREKLGLRRDLDQIVLADWGMERCLGDAPSQEWLVRERLALSSPSLFAAVGGAGKTWALIELAVKEALFDWTKRVQPEVLAGTLERGSRAVLYLAEESRASVHRRLEALDSARLRSALRSCLVIVPMTDVGGTRHLLREREGEFIRTVFCEDQLAQLEALDELALVGFDLLTNFAGVRIDADPVAAPEISELLGTMATQNAATVTASMS